MSDKQVQKAGDNSQQVQVEQVTVYNGITEQRAREIFSEMNAVARQSYTEDAYALAFKRVSLFEELLMSKIEKVDGLLEAFGDPSFQFLLTDAQKRAAASERGADYEMLTELLVNRVQNNDDRKNKASIAKAVSIIDQVDDDALCALTISNVLNAFGPSSGNITEGLKTMADLFDELCYMELPTGSEWIYHLDILDAVRISTLGNFRKFNDYYPQLLDGYTCVGIPKETDTYMKAVQLLSETELPIGILTDHELLDGYVRLNIRDRSLITDRIVPIEYTEGQIIVPNEKEIEVLNDIWSLYSTENKLHEQVKESFIARWDEHKSLQRIHLWRDSIPTSFSITPIGRVLAHANAQRYSKSIPAFNGLYQ